uniref:ATP synthase CF1 delta subunit n=1 Tax=Goniotrichopsis reniformis TaxID=468933 RepID=UPI001FCCF0E4|nr:ATP synthase CF1 delta subunit [Goniotrichopsis reniformis]UNJ14835.1 ATP synthase CF1 delta subunit [Goniotrichopsis reniformis]
MSSRAVVSKIALPYAEALLAMASSKGNVSVITEEIKLISNTLKSSDDLQSLLANPIVAATEKANLLEKLFSEQVNSDVLNFLKVLAQRKRLNILDVIVGKYLELAYEASQVTLAKVIASMPLSNAQEEALVTKLQSMTKASSVELVTEVDSSLIGGLTIQIGSQVIDTSLQGQIKQMASHLDINV